MLRMKHKDHGFDHAYNGNDEANLRKLGWIGEDETYPGEAGPVVPEPVADVVAEEVAQEAITTPVPARRGPKTKAKTKA